MKAKLAAGAAALAVAALILSGCSSTPGGNSTTSGSASTSPSASDSASSGSTLSDADLASFAAAAQKGEAPTVWQGPSTSPAIVPNQKIAVILCAAAAEGCVRIASGVKAAAQAIGWTEKDYDGQGQASVQSAAIQQAITEGATGIVLAAIDAHSVGQGMAAAKAAGVPVASVVGGNNIGDASGDVQAQPEAQAELAGENLANWVVTHAKGDVKVALFHAPEFADSILRYNGAKKVFQGCSTCQIVSDTTYASATAAQNIPLQTKAILQAHPEINYILIDIGGIGQTQVQAIDQAGLQAKVGLVSFDCNALDIENIRKGNVQVACEGLALEAGSWGAVDGLNRIFAGQPVEPTYVPIRTIDSTDLPSTKTYDADFDYQSAYLKLWGKK